MYCGGPGNLEIHFLGVGRLLTTYCLNVLLPRTFYFILFFYKSEKWYDFNACNNVRDILYNSDAITSTNKLIVHSTVGKLI